MIYITSLREYNVCMFMPCIYCYGVERSRIHVHRPVSWRVWNFIYYTTSKIQVLTNNQRSLSRWQRLECCSDLTVERNRNTPAIRPLQLGFHIPGTILLADAGNRTRVSLVRARALTSRTTVVYVSPHNWHWWLYSGILISHSTCSSKQKRRWVCETP